jgi:hypothetical protein
LFRALRVLIVTALAFDVTVGRRLGGFEICAGTGPTFADAGLLVSLRVILWHGMIYEKRMAR